MKLTKTSTQATLAIVFLSDRIEGPPTQARQVAEYLEVPTDSALKFLQALVRHNVLRSQLGRSGGYHLNREPDEITLLEIVEAIDGPIDVEIPLHVREQSRWATPAEVLHEVCGRVVRETREHLGNVTLAQLAADKCVATP